MAKKLKWNKSTSDPDSAILCESDGYWVKIRKDGTGEVGVIIDGYANFETMKTIRNAMGNFDGIL